ncbi:actin-binding protein Smlt3054-like [Sycon ciliatum]|uniref:actin-binding protein Smlt3054-like n=1 Tax=Sycon ciliatum TaxID=27933 RepID=UPI0031F61563
MRPGQKKIDVFQRCSLQGRARGDTPLHDAASIGKLDVCQALLAAGADCNIKNERGYSPVHYAAQRGKLEVCQALLAAGADCNIKNTGQAQDATRDQSQDATQATTDEGDVQHAGQRNLELEDDDNEPQTLDIIADDSWQ